MGVAVLNPQDCLKHPFSHMKYPRNPSSCPNRQKKPISNRTRRSPPRNQATRSPPPPVAPPLPPPRASVSPPVPKRTVKKSPNNSVPLSQVRILKRGEEVIKKTSDLVIEKSDLVIEKSDLAIVKSDLGSIRRIGPDAGVIQSQIRLSGHILKAPPFYAGPVTMTSPPPSAVPFPAFFTKKSVSLVEATQATNHLIRILRLDIA